MKVLYFFELYFIWLAYYVTGQPRLQIMPPSENAIVFVNSGYSMSCEIIGLGPQVVDVELRWYNPHGVELFEVSSQDRTYYVTKDVSRPMKTLTFKKVRFEDEGTYRCEGIVEGNLEVRKAALLVNKKVTFDYHPSPQMAKLYSNAFIECRVSGKPSPTVVWEYKGMRLIDNYRYTQDAEGLYIKNITKHDEGLYSCQAQENVLGQYDSREIEVIVQVPPMIDRSRPIFEGIQGHDFTLPCHASGDPQPRVEFFKDGSLAPLHTTKRRQYDPEGGELTFRPLHKEDEGNYLCKAFNNVGEDQGDINLTVIIPPSIYSLYNQSGIENGSVELSCLSHGDPVPQMSIGKAGAHSDFNIGENEGGRVVVTRSDDHKLVLRINCLVPEDMANYTCKSTNKAGNDHRNGTITVQFTPRFTAENIKQVYIWPGKTRNITCHTMSEPLPSFEWIKYPSIPIPIQNNETYRIHIMGKNSNLQVTVREQDQNWIYGNYTCRAANQIGRSELLIDLVRANVPGQPLMIDAKVVTSDHVILVVTPPENNGGSEITSYRVDYDAYTAMFYSEELLIEKLRPSTTYLFRVRAVSEVGYGEPYSMAVKTEDVRPPSKLKITSRTQSHLPNKYTITWAKPITGGLPIKEYEFKFRRVTGEGNYIEPVDDWRVRRRHDDDLRPMTSYVLDGLRGGTSYQLQIRARNDLGYSEFNDLFVFRTYDISEPESEHSQYSVHNQATSAPTIVSLIPLLGITYRWAELL